jgi:conjugative relaxase-like TrwC/TraI family protein
MSIHRLSAGSGYRYLLRSVATGDTPAPGAGLSAYYAATGTPPGRWYGTGLAGLGGDSSRLSSGDVVTENQLAALYGAGRDPVTDEPLGRGYRVYASVEERIARRASALSPDLDAAARTAALQQIRATEEARPVPVAVAGFDLTFTATKSISVLWGLSDPATRTVIEAAHHSAVADTLAYLERHAAFTRTGHDGVHQVRTKGLIVAAFDHPDTRTGDPNLHTHAVVANRVQGPDGQWRSLDSRVLHHAAVAASELYDSLLSDQLTRRLPVGFAWRSRGQRRSPAYELDGISDDLLGVFSTRSHDIGDAVRDLLAEFRERTGREPSRPEVLKLRQQATLATRPDKEHRSLRDLLTSWRTRAEHAGHPAVSLVRGACQSGHRRLWRHDEIPDNEMTTLVGTVLAGCQERRATWTIANIHAQVSRATRDLPMAATGDRLALMDALTRRVLAECASLYDTGLAHAAGVGPHVQDRRYSHRDLLAAELQLLQANTTPTPDTPVIPEQTARVAATQHRRGRDGRGFSLADDQVDAVVGIATAPRPVQVLVGPAGTGKTTTMRVLAEAWTSHHGASSVVGLASSATAAKQLSAALGVPCETTAKWRHETGKPAPEPGWELLAGQLVIVDEASLAGTRALAALQTHATAAGAKLLLVGDHAQLDAVDAGGAFGLLARHGQAHQLHSLWRFGNRWEANSTRALRAGDPDCLQAYQDHDRIHAGPTETMLDAAYEAWNTDITDGRTSLLVAADTATVDALNQRAHTDRVAAGIITGPTITIGDTSTGGPRGRVGVGDLVLTRRNDRTLTYPGGHVRNGEQWIITALHPDGALTLTPARDDPRGVTSVSMRVPAAYVREHIDPGYASTVHRAQGVTVDTSHLLATAAVGRRGVYVGMTRGHDANHLYLATDQPEPCDHQSAPPATTVHGTLSAILADDRVELSALETHADHVGWHDAIAAALAATDRTPPIATDPWAPIDQISAGGARWNPTPSERTIAR